MRILTAEIDFAMEVGPIMKQHKVLEIMRKWTITGNNWALNQIELESIELRSSNKIFFVTLKMAFSPLKDKFQICSFACHGY